MSGYDNEKYLAPDDAYAKLPECCKYERKKTTKTAVTTKNETVDKLNEIAMNILPGAEEVYLSSDGVDGITMQIYIRLIF